MLAAHNTAHATRRSRAPLLQRQFAHPLVPALCALHVARPPRLDQPAVAAALDRLGAQQPLDAAELAVELARRALLRGGGGARRLERGAARPSRRQGFFRGGGEARAARHAAGVEL